MSSPKTSQQDASLKGCPPRDAGGPLQTVWAGAASNHPRLVHFGQRGLGSGGRWAASRSQAHPGHLGRWDLPSGVRMRCLDRR